MAFIIRIYHDARSFECQIRGTRFSVTYMDAEICIMKTSGCNKEENWQKIGLLANNSEGKKESVIKKQDK